MGHPKTSPTMDITRCSLSILSQLETKLVWLMTMCHQTILMYGHWQKHGWNWPTVSLGKSFSLSAIQSQTVPIKVAGLRVAPACQAGQISCYVWCDQGRTNNLNSRNGSSVLVRLIVVYRPSYPEKPPIPPALSNEFGDSNFHDWTATTCDFTNPHRRTHDRSIPRLWLITISGGRIWWFLSNES